MHTPFHHSRPRSVRSSLIPVASTATLALLLAGCGGDGAAVAGSAGAGAGGTGASTSAPARFDPSLRDSPCSVVTVDTVASVFGLPAGEIEQHESSGMCLYNWKGAGMVMDATIHVTQVADDAAAAAQHFANVTRGMSSDELGKAMDGISEQARASAGPDSAAAGALLAGAADATRSASRGIEFSDVDGIGDQARMLVGRGDLRVLVDNLHFSVTAHHGERMTAPPDLTQLVAASRAWHQTTLAEREEQTIALARAAVAAL
ncbi:hypothetical protein WCE37_13330 [Luteimonas sp. MJ250]|uniref:hypothetical protein n=1 Tax=Luteimonas sp. MJ250 TaxID=3129236 RepID=UPI0031B9BCE7